MIVTPRLILRRWRDADLAPFSEQNADAETMLFLGCPLSRTESDAYAARMAANHETHGFGKWAVEAPGLAPFIGAVGLGHAVETAAYAPAVEIAWRLNRRYWGQGYATEAARAALADGFERLGLAEIVAMTSLLNHPSMRVMERLGMTRSIEFDHPRYPPGHRLRRHVLYGAARTQEGNNRAYPI